MQPTVGPKVVRQSATSEGVFIDGGQREAVGADYGPVKMRAAQVCSVKIGLCDRRTRKAGRRGICLGKTRAVHCGLVELGMAKDRSVKIGVLKRGAVEVAIVGLGVMQDGAIQDDPRQLGRGEPRRLHPRLCQIGPRQISARHLGRIKHRTGEVALGHMGLGQIGHVEIGAYGHNTIQDRPAQISTVKARIRQDGTRQIHPRQIGLLKVGTAQVAALAGPDLAAYQILHLIGRCGQRQAHNQRGDIALSHSNLLNPKDHAHGF